MAAADKAMCVCVCVCVCMCVSRERRMDHSLWFFHKSENDRLLQIEGIIQCRRRMFEGTVYLCRGCEVQKIVLYGFQLSGSVSAALDLIDVVCLVEVSLASATVATCTPLILRILI